MRKLFTLAAAFLAVSAQSLAATPCETIEPSKFQDWKTTDGTAIIDVGNVVKEKGNNICAIIMDTTAGRVQMVFTVVSSISGRGDIIKNLLVIPMD